MKIALVGNQNSGKTTLFNLLTGSNQKIGNWAGVTIERKTGIIKESGYEIVDLPGIYSLSPYTIEEEISRKFILEEKPDIIINIVDATSIERSLYLTTQLMELGTKVIVALNMEDRLNKKGIKINIDKLSKELGVDIVSISALKNIGISKLKAMIRCAEVDDHIRTDRSSSVHIQEVDIEYKHIFAADIENEIWNIQSNQEISNNRFIAIKILENDKMYQKEQSFTIKEARKRLENKYNMPIEEIIANARYEYIVNSKQNSVEIIKHEKETKTDKLDKIFLNKWVGLPIFAVIMFLVYYLSVGVVGSSTVELVGTATESFKNFVGDFLTVTGASEWSASLVVDGIIAGVGAVLGFVPQLIILFICISLLETTGYMSRVTMLLDKVFKRFGLSGETLIPFIVGLGCSVPAIMSTRVIKEQKERELSVMLTPFIPCSAKLPIIAMFAGSFFGSKSGLVSASLYFFAIAVILLSAMIIKKLFMKGNFTMFISELPEYQMPNIKYVARDVFEKTAEFIKRAGTIILFCSIIIWFLLSFSWKLEYGVDVEESILASIGNLFSWIFYPMLGALSWETTVSAIQGLVAKEQVISSMNIIAGLSEEGAEGRELFASSAFSLFTVYSAYAFMVFNLFSAPCFGAIGAMGRELGSKKKLFKAILFQTGLAWVLACLVYNIGTFIGRIV